MELGTFSKDCSKTGANLDFPPKWLTWLNLTFASHAGDRGSIPDRDNLVSH